MYVQHQGLVVFCGLFLCWEIQIWRVILIAISCNYLENHRGGPLFGRRYGCGRGCSHLVMFDFWRSASCLSYYVVFILLGLYGRVFWRWLIHWNYRHFALLFVLGHEFHRHLSSLNWFYLGIDSWTNYSIVCLSNPYSNFHSYST